MLLKLWRKTVVMFARRMPIESAGVCMAFSVLFLLTAVFILPEAAEHAAESPLIAEGLSAADGGWRVMHWIEGTMILGACLASSIFQARCLQLCYPKFYDPYAIE
jgi:hypothetical protein